jgi:hypothetical protein
MEAATPLLTDPRGVRVTDDREAIKEIVRRAEQLAAKGLRGKEFLRAFGIDDEGEPSVTIPTMEELDAVVASVASVALEDRRAPSSFDSGFGASR